MELIDRKALLERMNEFAAFAVIVKPYMLKDEIAESVLKQAKEQALRLVEEAPTIEAAPVVHGEWKFTSRLRNGRSAFSIRCSVCDSSQGANWMNYCPNCGAKMTKRN